jgi:adenylylsulfate kinase
MTQRILVMGLPGAGKTTLAKALADKLDAMWFNADDVRRQYDDWDFSYEGRIRQSLRMRDLADDSYSKYVIVDFVCPLPEMRDNFNADYTIWVDTIRESRYSDTNNMFVEPDTYDFRITEQDSEKYSEIIARYILAE